MACSQRSFVYLAYLDDSDTRSKNGEWQVLCGVVVRDVDFTTCELLSSIVIETLMPKEKIAEFEEFHACELYGGYGIFEGIAQDKRFAAINRMLSMLDMPLHVVYGAVNSKVLSLEVYGSADPIDVCFRMCAEGIDAWICNQLVKEMQATSPVYSGDELMKFAMTSPHLGLIIIDDCDGKTKKLLQESFRTLRQRLRPPTYSQGKLSSMHDDMYFGDSRYSVGIQLADLCSYFIARHLDGDMETESFYKIIEPNIVYSKCIPDVVINKENAAVVPAS
jgi:hypothetical protein